MLAILKTSLQWPNVFDAYLQILQVKKFLAIFFIMNRERFPLTSEQLELLLAFERAGNLERLSDLMAKDSSVISRNLRKMADEWPVVIKSSGRWQITPLGRQLNILSREFQEKLLSITGPLKRQIWINPVNPLSSKSLLVVINAQKDLADPARGRRNNSSAENNIAKILQFWRKKRWPIAYAKHISENPASFFYSSSSSVDFIPLLAPVEGDNIFEKNKPSALSSKKLVNFARKLQIETLVLVGFTAGECIDVTARDGNELNFKVTVVADATAAFDIKGPTGKIHKAENVHRGTLAVLHSLFASITNTDDLLN